MKKIQDIVGSNRRSIRSISINRESRRRSRVMNNAENSNGAVEYHHKNTPSFGIWIVAVLAILFLFLTFTVLFSGTKVVVIPKSQKVSFDSKFEAYKTSSGDRLQYDVMSVSREVSRVVPSTGEEFQETKASGTIIVYNDYNSKNQKLIEKTRFETPNGLIYRIKNSIVVPGRQKDSSGKVVPGSIEVKVFADETGDKYNIDLQDFTVPGFKGAPQFDGFYARSKTPMTGGFAGIVKTVSDQDRSQSIDSMQTELREILLEEMRAQVPEGFILYDDGIVFNFDSSTEKNTDSDKVEITQSGELNAIVFDKKALSEHIARTEIDDYDGLPVEGQDLSTLIFVLEDKENTDIINSDKITFSLKGTTNLLWLYDSDSLKKDLVGKRKRDVDWVLAEYPGIKEAQIVMRPFWKSSFPDKESKIKIVQSTSLD